MDLTTREFWALVHGFLLGGLFIVAFAGGFAGLFSLRPELVTAEGARERMRRLTVGLVTMATVAWLTVITGTWIVYPWYREDTPDSARSRLLENPDTENWHEFGMEWKEHVAWIAPMLATVAAFIVIYYRSDLLRNRTARLVAITLFSTAFVIAAIAGILGGLITKSESV
jgi:hypothetical protein